MTNRFFQRWSQLVYSLMRNARESSVRTGKTIDFFLLEAPSRYCGETLLARIFMISG